MKKKIFILISAIAILTTITYLQINSKPDYNYDWFLDENFNIVYESDGIPEKDLSNMINSQTGQSVPLRKIITAKEAGVSDYNGYNIPFICEWKDGIPFDIDGNPMKIDFARWFLDETMNDAYVYIDEDYNILYICEDEPDKDYSKVQKYTGKKIITAKSENSFSDPNDEKQVISEEILKSKIGSGNFYCNGHMYSIQNCTLSDLINDGLEMNIAPSKLIEPHYIEMCTFSKSGHTLFKVIVKNDSDNYIELKDCSIFEISTTTEKVFFDAGINKGMNMKEILDTAGEPTHKEDNLYEVTFEYGNAYHDEYLFIYISDDDSRSVNKIMMRAPKNYLLSAEDLTKE